MAFSGTQHELQYACAPTRLTAQYHTLAGFGWIEYLLQLFFYKLHKLVFINDDFNQYILKEWVKQSLNNTTYTIRRFYTFENWKFTRHKKWAVMRNSKLCEIQRVLRHKNYQKRKRNVSDCVYNLKKVDYGILHLGASNSSFLKLWNKSSYVW